MTACVARADRPYPGGLWLELRREAAAVAAAEPALAGLLDRTILARSGLAEALTALLSAKLSAEVNADAMADIIAGALEDDPEILAAVEADLAAVRERDPAACDLLHPFLHYKGFQAVQAHRVAHHHWHSGRRWIALHLQSAVTERFGVDIHPAARIGRRVLIDHGTGVVIGETAVVGDDVSILQGVTLGGTGKQAGDRHPKVRNGVLIGAGAKILGNLEIGMCAKVGAGSVVLHPVPAFATVAGVPARVVGRRAGDVPGLNMDHSLPEHAFVEHGAGI